MINEIFENIIWYRWKYKVSNLWNVKSLIFWKEKILKLEKTSSWYLRVTLYKDNKRKHYKIHRIVLNSFMWENKLQVNHKNWIKTDNRLENLEYCTHSDNQKHSYNILWRKSYWKWKTWKDWWISKKVKQYTKEWKFIRIWESLTDINKEIWIAISSISNCCSWQRKTSWWFKWEYN